MEVRQGVSRLESVRLTAFRWDCRKHLYRLSTSLWHGAHVPCGTAAACQQHACAHTCHCNVLNSETVPLWLFSKTRREFVLCCRLAAASLTGASRRRPITPCGAGPHAMQCARSSVFLSTTITSSLRCESFFCRRSHASNQHSYTWVCRQLHVLQLWQRSTMCPG